MVSTIEHLPTLMRVQSSSCLSGLDGRSKLCSYEAVKVEGEFPHTDFHQLMCATLSYLGELGKRSKLRVRMH